MQTAPILHYHESGEGPLVVLLHGYMSSSRYWQRVTDDLSRRHRVIALDLLGFGHSPKPVRSRYGYNAHLASIGATLDQLGVNEPFTLIGHSMGSLIALRYTRIYPKNVKKLLLTNMPIFKNRRDAKQEVYGTNLLYSIALRPGFHNLIWPIFRISTLLHLVPAKIGELMLSKHSYIFQNTAASRLRSMRNIIFAAKIDADLRAIQVETIMLSGLQDRARYFRNLSAIPLNPYVQAKNVEGGHHLPLFAPEAITELV